MMKILVTGSKGFMGKNLIAELRNQNYTDVLEYNRETDHLLLDSFTKDCDFVFHLAGINRPKNVEEYMEGNFGFSSELLSSLKKNCNKCTVMISSSIQAAMDNIYGRSKKAAEDLLLSYSRETGVKVLVYRFPNVFGKWCKPDYNSAVATFCHNIARGKSIHVNDPNTNMKLAYIDDVVQELINALKGNENKNGEFCEVPVTYDVKLGDVAELIMSFKETRKTLSIPNMSDPFEKKLYSTYISYLPQDQFSYPLKMNSDHRGSFTEIIRTNDRGQFSVNITKPGITKGNHYHHTKCEKFIVISGSGLIRFRKIDSEEIIDYYVSGDKMEAVDIPPGYTHNIINVGDTDLVTIMWANEIFNQEKPDTYFLEV